MVGAAFSFCAAGTAMAKSYSFDTIDSYNSLLQTGSAVGSYSSTGGIGGSGSIVVAASTGNNLPKYFTEPDRLFTNEPITLSLNFQWTPPTQAGTIGYAVVLGIGSNAGGNTLTPYVSPYTEATTGSQRDELYLGIRTNGNVVDEIQGSQVYFLSGSVKGLAHSTTYSAANSAFLQNNGWYSISATFAPLDNNSGFKLSLALYEVDALTGSIGEQLLTGSVDILNPELLGSSVNSFFAVRSAAWGGVSHIDNFSSPIPEPSTVAAFLTGSGLLLLLRNKRRGGRQTV